MGIKFLLNFYSERYTFRPESTQNDKIASNHHTGIVWIVLKQAVTLTPVGGFRVKILIPKGESYLTMAHMPTPTTLPMPQEGNHLANHPHR